MLKAIVMDFDGVIIDSEALWYQIFAEWFQTKKNYDLSMDEFLCCVGSDSPDLFASLKEKGIIVDAQAFRNDTQQEFIDKSAFLPLMDGVKNFIEETKKAGLLLALATSASRPKPVYHLERFGLLDDFDALITSEYVERIKPFPDLFIKTAEILNISPDEALVVEDSQHGLDAANRAGMPVLIIPNEITKRQAFSGYYLKAPSLADVHIGTLSKEYVSAIPPDCQSPSK